MATGSMPVEVNTSRSLRGSSSSSPGIKGPLTKNNSKKQHKTNKKLESDRNQEKCPDCSLEVKDNAEAIECDICKGWYHKGCQNVSDALYAVLISDENQQISWYCKSCQRGAKAIMSHILIMHERQDQFKKKLNAMENKHKALHSRVNELQETLSKVSDLQSQATHESFVASHVQPDINKEDIVATVCTQINDRLTRLKNIIVYNVPEGTSTLKADNAIHDTNLMKELLGHTTGGKYQPEDLPVKRLGSKQTKETETQETKNRPLLVTFPEEDKKTIVMENLYKLKNRGEPFSGMIIKHDMSRDDREKERLLQKEARERTQQEQTTNVVYLVRGRPGERQIIKVKKRGEITSQTRALPVSELEK